MLRRACAFPLILLVIFAATPRADQKKPVKVSPPPPIAPLDLAHTLDLYAGGHFDEAVQSVAHAGDGIGRHLRQHWAVTGQQWIDADPAHRPERILAAAALALETEHTRAERGDWRISDGNPPCAAACVLDWAQMQLVQRGDPDRAEREWYLAAAALAGGVRDWRYLQRWVDVARAAPLMPGLMDRAIARLPDDPSLRLERALAAASRFNVTPEGGFGGLGVFRDAQAGAVDLLSALVSDPIVGAEARLRLGYLLWTINREAAARTELAKAAAQTTDNELRYLSEFLLGWMAVMRGDSVGAIPRLEASLTARPGSQSAAVVLASLELQRGDADKAAAITRASLDQREADLDPWRLFFYGHHPQWPARLAALRRAVKP